METETKINSENSEISQSSLTQQNDLLLRNLKVSEEILEKTKYIKNYIKWQKVWSIVQFSLIVIPIIVGVLYLPPLIKDYINQFSSLYK